MVFSPLKDMLICPFLKKPSLDPTIQDNLQPVSDLPVLGKLMAKVIHSRFSQDPGLGMFLDTEITLIVLLDDLWWEQVEVVHPS